MTLANLLTGAFLFTVLSTASTAAVSSQQTSGPLAELSPPPEASIPPQFTGSIDGYSHNLLNNFTNRSFSSSATSAQVLKKSGDILITGVIAYPPNVLTHPEITNDDEIVTLDKRPTYKRSSSILIRLSPNGLVRWAVRTVLCANNAHFTVIVDETGSVIYVTGSTTGAFHHGNQTASKKGAVLMTFGLDGKRANILVHGDNHQINYLGASFMKNDPDALLLIGQCGGKSTVFEKGANPPSDFGICGTLLNQADLSIVAHRGLSDGPINNNVTKLGKDELEHMAVSKDGKIVYIAAKRQLWTNFSTITSAIILAVATDSLLPTTQPISIALRLARKFRLATLPGGDVVAAFVTHDINEENIIVVKFTEQLRIQSQGTESHKWTRPIEAESHYSRPITTEMHAMVANERGEIVLVLYTSEVIDRRVGNATDLASLSNGRIATLVLQTQPMWNLKLIAQSRRPDWWNGMYCALANEVDKFVVVGQDRGITGSALYRKGQLLVTRLPDIKYRDDVVSDTKKPVQSEEGNPWLSTQNSSQKTECIGESSRVANRPLMELVAADAQLRLQTHILKKLMRRISNAMQTIAILNEPTSRMVDETDDLQKVHMLCTEWDEGASRLCATRFHIMRFAGQLRYMHEVCRQMVCHQERDIAFNFKGECGHDVPVREDLSITMHMGHAGVDAVQAMGKECVLQNYARVLWRLMTM